MRWIATSGRDAKADRRRRGREDTRVEKCLSWTEEDVAFAKFIQKKIFPGGQLRSPSTLCRYAKAAGFETTRIQSLQPHYAKTLDAWADRLSANREDAIELTSPEIYDMYMRYITGRADR